MGNLITSVFNKLFGRKPLRILMLGMDGAGKTTVLYTLKLGHLIQTIPTIGFNVETIEYNNLSFTVWDVGFGGGKLTPLWRHYFDNTQGLIFVVDCSDRERINECRDLLMYSIFSDELLNDTVFLILANKQDIAGAMDEIELTDKLGLNSKHGRKWHVQPTSALKGDGLYEGFDWLSKQLASS